LSFFHSNNGKKSFLSLQIAQIKHKTPLSQQNFHLLYVILRDKNAFFSFIHVKKGVFSKSAFKINIKEPPFGG